MKTRNSVYPAIFIILAVGIAGMSFASTKSAEAPAEPMDPIAAIIQAFDSHDVVAIGERHLNYQDYEFRVSLIQDPRFADVVNDIVVEAGNAFYQDIMDRFISGENVPDDELRKTWLTTTQGSLWGGSTIYEDFYRAVREVNLSLPKERKLRVLLGDPPVDPENNSQEEKMKSMSQRDSYPAGLIEREVLAKGRKALVVYGAGHYYRKAIQYKLSPTFPQQMAENINRDPETLVVLLERSGANVFTIFPEEDSKFSAIQPDVAKWDMPAIALIKETVLGQAPISSFMPDAAGMIRFMDETGQERTETLTPDPDNPVLLQEQFDAILVQKGQAPIVSHDLDSSQMVPLSTEEMDKLAGQWEGKPDLPQGAVDAPPTYVFRFFKNNTGEFAGSLSHQLEEDYDALSERDKQFRGIIPPGESVPVTEMGTIGKLLSFKVPDQNLEYAGSLSDEGIVGELKLPMGDFLALSLKKTRMLPFDNAMAGQSIIGTWQGTLMISPENELAIQFIISQDEENAYTVILNSPDQGAIKNIKANSVAYDSGVLRIDVAELSGSYEGTVKDRLMEGAWKQEGTSFPLNMTPYQKRIITQEDIDAAIAAANAFVELTDTDQRGDAYALMTKDIKRMITEEQFGEGQEMIREQFGKPKSRNILSSGYSDEIMGETGGDHVEIVFETTFDKQEEPMVERIIMTDENGEWKVGTHVFSPMEMYQEMQAQEAGLKDGAGPGDIMAIISSAEEVPMDQDEIDAALAAAQQFFETNNLPSPMGEVESREMTSAKGVHIKDMPNQPDGDYIKIEFETHFKENENAQLETVLLNNHNGNWMVRADLFGSPIGLGGSGGEAGLTD